MPTLLSPIVDIYADQIAPLIQKTTDYTMFRSFEGNRKLNKNHLKKVQTSIAAHNLLPYNPIMVTKDMKVIDGQHRLEIAKRLKTPIYYVVVPAVLRSDLHLLNYNVRPWRFQDFLDNYVSLGYESYIKIKELKDAYDLSISSALLLLGRHVDSSRIVADTTESDNIAFKEGKFKIVDEKRAYAYAEELNRLRQFITADYVGRKVITGELIVAFLTFKKHDIGIDILLEKLTRYDKMFPKHASIIEYLRFIEAALNFQQTKNIYRLF